MTKSNYLLKKPQQTANILMFGKKKKKTFQILDTGIILCNVQTAFWRYNQAKNLYFQLIYTIQKLFQSNQPDMFSLKVGFHQKLSFWELV